MNKGFEDTILDMPERLLRAYLADVEDGADMNMTAGPFPRTATLGAWLLENGATLAEVGIMTLAAQAVGNVMLTSTGSDLAYDLQASEFGDAA